MHFLFRIIRWVLLHSIAPLLFLGAGWYGGAKYGAPDLLIRAIDGLLARAGVTLTPLIEEGVDRGGEIAVTAVQQGSDYVVGTVEQMLEDLAEAPEEEGASEEEASEGEEADASIEAAPPPDQSAETADVPAPIAAPDGIVLCKMRISNPPRSGAPEASIGPAGETVRYKGVSLLLMPATDACLSSGYGYRNGRLHRGVDYFSDTGGDALAAGDGVIAEAVSRSDYGNMVVIDHGNDVFTRYAHLARFGSGVQEGASVSQGQVLGPIGNTGSSSIVHLHYEVLTGDYNTNAKSFGLEAVDPFGL